MVLKKGMVNTKVSIINIKENGKMENLMDKENLNLQILFNIMEILKMEILIIQENIK